MSKLNVVFFGTPDFSVPSLEMLHKHPLINVASVVSMPDRPKGRGHQLSSPEVIEYAKLHKISYFQTSNINQEHEFLENMKNAKVDVFIVLAFAQFLSAKTLAVPTLGAFNIHTSLLPKYRGAAPIQYSLLNGDTSTGVSIQKMVKKMDAGDIAWSNEVGISPHETGGSLYTRLKFQAALSLNDFINTLACDNLSFVEQDESMVTFAPTLSKEDGKLDFKNSSYNTLNNQIRALDPWPGTFCLLNNKRLKVHKISAIKSSLKPGEVDLSHGQIIIGCLDSSLRLESVQLEGKRRTSDTELLRGMREKIIIN